MPSFRRLHRNRTFLLVAGFLVLLFICFLGYREWYHNYYEALTVTGATPLAIQGPVPRGFKIEVTGDVKKVYRFGSSALRAFATTRIRTKEVAPDGIFWEVRSTSRFPSTTSWRVLRRPIRGGVTIPRISL